MSPLARAKLNLLACVPCLLLPVLWPLKLCLLSLAANLLSAFLCKRPINASRPPPCKSASYQRRDRNIALRSTLAPKPTSSRTICYQAANNAIRQPRIPRPSDIVYDCPKSVTAPAAYMLSRDSLGSQLIAGANALLFCPPLSTLKELSIQESDLCVWIENLRVWLSTRVFKQLTADIERVESFLRAHGLEHLSLLNAVPAVAEQSQVPNSLSSLLAAFNCQEAELRVGLERFLFVANYPPSSRLYVLERILQLSRGLALTCFRWNGGSSAWTCALPTDAQLVMHVFCTFMDLQMPGSKRGCMQFSLFTTKYLVETDVCVEHLHIRMASCHPPHYVLSKQKVLYDVFPKNNNVFAAIALFVYLVKTESMGYVDMLDIAGNAVGLAFIVD